MQKKIRIIFIVLTIIWMIIVFCFSNEQSDDSSQTSSGVTEAIIRIIYENKLSEDEIELKVQEIEPIMRKVAHYTLYTAGGLIIFCAVYTYEKTTKMKILITQLIGTFYSITDEIHQYFVPRQSV